MLKDFFRKRKTQIRVILELQKSLISRIKGFAQPQENSSMLLCVSSFPSLKFGDMKTPEISTTEKKENTILNMSDVLDQIEVHPVLAPKKFHIDLYIRMKREGRSIKSVTISALLPKTGSTPDDTFQWKRWSDAFCGRMVGAREGKAQHGMKHISECVTYADISDKIEHIVNNERNLKMEIKLWTGWLPLHPQICSFELEEGEILSGNVKNYHRKVLGRLSKLCEQEQKREPMINLFPFSIRENVSMKNMVNGVLKKYEKDNSSKISSNDDLSILEVAGSNGDKNAYEKAMETLCKKYEGVGNLLRALTMTEKLVENGENVEEADEDNVRKKVEIWYLKLVKYSQFRASIVFSFSRFQRTTNSYKDKLTEGEMICILRQSFLRTESSMILWEMMRFSSYCSRLEGKRIDQVEESRSLKIFEWLFEKPTKHFQIMFSNFISLHRSKDLSMEDRNLSNLALNVQEESLEDFYLLNEKFHCEIEEEEKRKSEYYKQITHSHHTKPLARISIARLEEKIQFSNNQQVNFARALASMHFSEKQNRTGDILSFVIYHCQAISFGAKKIY